MAKRYGVKIFCLDNLMVIENEESDELKAQTKTVKRLKSFAKKYNAVVHLIAHPKKPQNGQVGLGKFDVSGSANITNLADYVIIIERIKDEEDSTKDKHTVFTVDKDRYMGARLAIELLFDRDRRRFYCKNGMGEELNVDYTKEGFEQVDLDDFEW